MSEEYEIIFITEEGRAIKNNKTGKIYYSEFEIIDEKNKEIERLNKLISQREKKWEKWTTEKTILSTKMSDYLCKYQNLKREYTKQIKISTNKKRENERLNKELEEIKSKDVYEELLELRGRVFKAIDYIKFHFNDMVANVLIDILKGNDKE